MKNLTKTLPVISAHIPPDRLIHAQLRIGAILFAANALSPIGAIGVGIDYLEDSSLMVHVGDKGNLPDPNTGNLYGSVGYDYDIGKYEVTNSQYVKFLNDVSVTQANNKYGLYNPLMATAMAINDVTRVGGIMWDTGNNKFQIIGNDKNGSNMGEKAVSFVSFYDAARFCNWLTNGGTSGSDTENGVYTFSGGTLIAVADHANATGWALPSENEWYKAAYYDTYNPIKEDQWCTWESLWYKSGDDSEYRLRSATGPKDWALGSISYWDYANYNYYYQTIASVDHFIADYARVYNESFYGTFQQGGNVSEWNDTNNEGFRGVRGGSFMSESVEDLTSGKRYVLDPIEETAGIGFRVVRLIAVPEPQTYALFGGALLSGVIFLRRRRK